MLLLAVWMILVVVVTLLLHHGHLSWIMSVGNVDDLF